MREQPAPLWMRIRPSTATAYAHKPRAPGQFALSACHFGPGPRLPAEETGVPVGPRSSCPDRGCDRLCARRRFGGGPAAIYEETTTFGGPRRWAGQSARDCLCVDNNLGRFVWVVGATVYAWTKLQVTVGTAAPGVSSLRQLDARVSLGRIRTHRTAIPARRRPVRGDLR